MPPLPTTTREQWFHGTLSRDEASAKLKVEAQRLEEGSGLIDNTISAYDTGVYLVRISDKPNQAGKKYVISLLEERKPKNYEIMVCDKFFYIDEGPYMPSLEHLIEHYQNFVDGLPTRLKYAVKPPIVPPAPPVIDFNTIRKSRQQSLPNTPSSFSMQASATSPVAPPVPPLPNKMPSNSGNNNASAAPEKPTKQQKHSPIKTIITDGFRSFRRNKSSSNNNNLSAANKSNDIKLEIASSPLTNLTFTSDFHLDQMYQTPREQSNQTTVDDYIKDDKNIVRSPAKTKETVKYANLPSNIISRDKLNILDGIGQGEFGFVYRGIYLHHSGKIEVAIKKLPDNHSQEDHSSFIREAQYMMDLYHPCIVRLIGICLVSTVLQPGLVLFRNLIYFIQVVHLYNLYYSMTSVCSGKSVPTF